MEITLEQLKRAIEIKEQIARLEKELEEILKGVEPAPKRGRPPGATEKRGRPKKRQLSPEARARIAAAQKARWEKLKSQQQSEPQVS
ncbi:MAG: hypothetical protein ACP5MG_12880 [Verrucomicrobiia bacterium]|jgi:hypothetical protein